jgi:hypothetical protein
MFVYYINMPKSKQEEIVEVVDDVDEVVDNEPVELVIPEKPVKPKRVMTPEALEKLAKARVKAFEVKSANKAIRLKNAGILEEQVKSENLVKQKAKATKKVASRPTVVEPVEVEKVEEEPEPEEEPVRKTKKKPKKKPVVIIESSSSDEEQDNVIYIKRRSSKKKAAPAEAPPTREQSPPPVVRQEVSVFDKQMQLQRSALGMF